ncbi:hypothetical protein AB1Y20_023491 [Prymnesium parvum]|uniref:Glycosyltransferase 2-like domain-containing protein n=1 Tax=Prymnesium parvum TaxID=97485 RepID=A0AB34JE36_PRYPA
MTAASADPIAGRLTIGIKHTSRFPRRRQMLQLLLSSIRQRYPSGIRILVADDGGAADAAAIRAAGAELLPLPADSGLGYGRNALVAATRTAYFVLLDDDVFFHAASSLEVLVAALEANPAAALAAGCYRDIRFEREDCFTLRFDVEEDGALVHARAAPARPDGCALVHAAHNFFVARTRALVRFAWDGRQRVMEHETFFYQLYLNEQPVLSCPRVSVGHNTTRDDEYRERSFRLREGRFMQYLCKNFPEVATFTTPYLRWRCASRTYCGPAWHAQFAYDGRQCHAMAWDPDDDRSTVRRPLVPRAVRGDGRFPAAAASGRRVVPLLVLIFTERRNAARRAWQRATWLSFAWHRGYLERELVPWRHLYVEAARRRASAAASHRDEVVGDTLTLSNASEGYKNLVFKTMEALRWCLAHVEFEVLLKTDDDSLVHVGRLWHWLQRERLLHTPPPSIDRLYAGRLFRHSQVIRRNFTRADLWHPDWYPPSFRKWAVDYSIYPAEAYPPYCGGGGYLIGHRAASLVLREYELLPLSSVPRVEDAFVGVLAHAQKLQPTEIETFQEPPRGSHQTREMFIDQTLVHRVLEPFKAFRWLMLSSNCHAGPRECARQHNRTHGLPYDAVEGSLEGEISHESPLEKDWVSGPIPTAHPRAFTGTDPLQLIEQPYSASKKVKGGRRKRGRGELCRGMAPISLSKPLRTVAPIVKFQDETFKRPRVQAVPNDMLRFPNKAWWKVRRLKDLKVQNGARFWLVGWDGSDSGGQPWPDSWEPTANVSKDLIDDFLINRREEVSSRIPVDIRPLRTLVQRSVAAAVMKDKNSAFGRVHEINLDALSLRDLALYYIHSIGEQYQVPIKEQYNPKDKITITMTLGRVLSLRQLVFRHSGRSEHWVDETHLSHSC